jgi:hypothetical protein
MTVPPFILYLYMFICATTCDDHVTPHMTILICAGDLTYRGCFTNEGEHRVNGHFNDKAVEECACLAEEKGTLYFGIENAAECLIMSFTPDPAQRVSDDECAVEIINGDSRWLGRSHRLAVYGREGACHNFLSSVFTSYILHQTPPPRGCPPRVGE